MEAATSIAVMVLAAAFAVLFAFGLVTPCMTLHLDTALLYKSYPQWRALSGIIEREKIPTLLQSEVSVTSCLAGLAEWVAEGDANGAIALAMYAIFAVLLPVLDVAALLVAVLIDGLGEKALEASHVLRKLAMLDVSVMGVIVVVVALSTLEEVGVVVSLGPGIGPLIAAECCHYVLILIFHLNAGVARGKACPLDDGSPSGPCQKEEASTPCGTSTSEASSVQDSRAPLY